MSIDKNINLTTQDVPGTEHLIASDERKGEFNATVDHGMHIPEVDNMVKLRPLTTKIASRKQIKQQQSRF